MINNSTTTHNSNESLACLAEVGRLQKLHSPYHWWVIVWQKTKKWTECIKCNIEATEENYNKECKRRELKNE